MGATMENLKNIFDSMLLKEINESRTILNENSFFEKTAEVRKNMNKIENIEILKGLFKKESNPYSEIIGTHPDFQDMQEGDTRYQYISSVFLDISGSTKLNLRFSLQDVQNIKNSILKNTIQIFQVFDGHIHRLQGDAAFSYFGHRHMKKSDALINALNATSLMQAYNQYTLNDFFESINLEPPKIRIGIDIGDDEQVLWSFYGLESTSEVTSTSLHTDLAAKLQAKSPKNETMLGENVYNFLDLPQEFLRTKEYKEDGETKKEEYILEDSRSQAKYSMKIFEWEKYLNTFVSFADSNKSTKYQAPKDFQVDCYYKDNEEEKLYISNSSALSKDIDLTFELNISNKLLERSCDHIKWKVINRGYDAENSKDELEFNMDKYDGQSFCFQKTAYNGHHYMECKLFNSRGSLLGKSQFGIYVNDENYRMPIVGNQ